MPGLWSWAQSLCRQWGDQRASHLSPQTVSPAESLQNDEASKEYTLPAIQTHQPFIDKFKGVFARERDAKNLQSRDSTSAACESNDIVPPSIPINVLQRHRQERTIFPRSEDEREAESMRLSLSLVRSSSLAMVPSESLVTVAIRGRETAGNADFLLSLSEHPELDAQTISEAFFGQTDDTFRPHTDIVESSTLLELDGQRIEEISSDQVLPQPNSSNENSPSVEPEQVQTRATQQPSTWVSCQKLLQLKKTSKQFNHFIRHVHNPLMADKQKLRKVAEDLCTRFWNLKVQWNRLAHECDTVIIHYNHNYPAAPIENVTGLYDIYVDTSNTLEAYQDMSDRIIAGYNSQIDPAARLYDVEHIFFTLFNNIMQSADLAHECSRLLQEYNSRPGNNNEEVHSMTGLVNALIDHYAEIANQCIQDQQRTDAVLHHFNHEQENGTDRVEDITQLYRAQNMKFNAVVAREHSLIDENEKLKREIERLRSGQQATQPPTPPNEIELSQQANEQPETKCHQEQFRKLKRAHEARMQVVESESREIEEFYENTKLSENQRKQIYDRLRTLEEEQNVLQTSSAMLNRGYEQWMQAGMPTY